MDPRFKGQFASSAELFPHIFDISTDQVLVSRLREADFKAASFLDQRLLTDTLQRDTMRWSDLADIEIPAQPAPNFIFHIGHVGSTLIARLLGEHNNTLALREPHILRSFADIGQIKLDPTSPWSPAVFEQRLQIVLRWLSRGFHPEQRSLIKASSFVSEISGDVFGEQTKALCLFVPLNVYLPSIFAGAGSRQEARQLAAARLTRLHRRLGTPIGNLWELSEGQIIALGWLTEMITLKQSLAAKNQTQILWQDFDMFLKRPARSLLEIATHLGIDFSDTEIEQLVSGPIMRSYSKAPEHDYSPNLRRDLLRQARSQHGEEIKTAERWVTSVAKSHTEIAALINRE